MTSTMLSSAVAVTSSSLNETSPGVTFQSLARDMQWRKLLSLEPFHIRIVFDEKSTLTTFKLCQGVKRLLDIVLSFGILLAASPVMLVTALAIKLTSKGPLIYKSLRIGQGQKPFYMYKFRTMVVNADQQREKLKQANKLEGQLFKISNDPRMTPIGAFLRKYSLDEFPQLLNVLRGEMSLVGPRPYVPDESAMFKEPYTLRFKVTPGVTGMWQVSGRSNLSFEQLSELDLYYTLQWSLWQDVKILLKTLPAVLLRRGAY
ncbi:MAG: sugar transferase [Vampirovibrionales bacterium]|nr:sugar transferase [Vampirovibrionales bacterium]